MNLFESLQQSEPLNVAVVGAGGKTTAVFQLARQVSGCAWVTTTTHLGTDQLHLADKHFTIKSADDIDVPGWLAQKVSLLTGERTPDDRIKAPNGDLPESIAALAKQYQVSLIIEADGARSHAIKAPGEHEPVIPAWVSTVIVVVGLSALGKPLSAAWVHRPEPFARLSGILPGMPITLEGTIQMLLDPAGGLKGIPENARKIVLFNQSDTVNLSSDDLSKMRKLLDKFDRVLVAALATKPGEVISLSPAGRG